MRALVLLCALTAVAHAQDPFVIQVQASEVAPRGEAGFDLHVNHHLIDGASNVTNTTLEPHYGLTGWLELGGFLESSMVRGERPELEGGRLRVKARYPRRIWHDRLGFAVDGELSIVRAEVDPDVYGAELRPIADLVWSRFYVAVNPILGTGPGLEAAGKAEVWVAHGVGVGAEAYVDRDSVDVFGVIDLHAGWIDVDVGLGATDGGPDHPIAKLILGLHP